MGNRKMYAKFQENLFSGNEIKSIFCPPLFRKRPMHFHNARAFKGCCLGILKVTKKLSVSWIHDFPTIFRQNRELN